MATESDIPPKELQRRVLYSLIMSAVRIARKFRIPLKELISLVETGYFREIRAEGRTLKESAELLGVSQRTAVRLSKQLRDAFFIPEVGHNLPRRIEFMLATRPMGAARLVQVLRDTDASLVEQTIQDLLAGGRIREVRGRTLMYEAVTDLRRLPRDTWMARVGGLNSFVENITNTTYGRFFTGDQRTFARTLTFSLRPEDLEVLGALYEQQVLRTVRELGDEADAAESAVDMQLSVCWAPYEYLTSEDEDKS